MQTSRAPRSTSSSRTNAGLNLPVWLRVLIVFGALLMVMGGVIAWAKPGMLLTPNSPITEGVRVYAGYLVSRNLCLALMLLAMWMLRARGALGTLLLLNGFVQLFDAVIDVGEGRWMLVPGVLVLSLIFFLGAARVSGFAFWRREAYR